ncbi:hypothetical protein SAMN02745704_01348 [Paucidesulfovibrio gracilis DSM 16080]|uniref:Uncharacterized protein n=1 Tax=Paucidesulfovibrio gracilis DSM 16080 TaxID=1121449 RepID=A0A1T4WU74_9BACT|nr:hypothetical protein [Paucidesulfovibrio gracilis]SKA80408.1 hypothetical protein SAMN02745704_01348 [Paucidesulfovibrio gracilis DSM 16080]
MSNVRKMPGNACRYYVAGRCNYHERLNPGYDESLRCRFLVQCEDAFDAFLDRAEAFALSQEQTVAFWNRRFQRLQEEGCFCPDYCYSEDGGDQGCVHGYGDVCILALPKCEGRCRRFVLIPEVSDNNDYKES